MYVPVPAPDGVPDTVPSAKLSHGDPLNVNWYGGVPPDGAAGIDNGTPTCALVGHVPPIEGGPVAICNEHGPRVAVPAVPNAARIENVATPGGPEGVPAITPLLNVRPAGSSPPKTVNTGLAVPPPRVVTVNGP